MQVAARTSSFSFKEQPDIVTVAHKFNVAAVLEGSVRRSAHTVRVTAQLVNAVTGFHLWSKTFDRDLVREGCAGVPCGDLRHSGSAVEQGDDVVVQRMCCVDRLKRPPIPAIADQPGGADGDRNNTTLQCRLEIGGGSVINATSSCARFA